MNILKVKKLRNGNKVLKFFCIAMVTLFMANANAANRGG